jgi:hypothetical protein
MIFDTRIQCEELSRDWIDDAIDDEIDDNCDWESISDHEYGEVEY